MNLVIGDPAMAATTTKKRDEQAEKIGQKQALVAKQVMDVLGRPPAHEKTKVVFLWDQLHARVNVYAENGGGTYKITDSFFLHLDGDGGIIDSNPPLKKRY